MHSISGKRALIRRAVCSKRSEYTPKDYKIKKKLQNMSDMLEYLVDFTETISEDDIKKINHMNKKVKEIYEVYSIQSIDFQNMKIEL